MNMFRCRNLRLSPKHYYVSTLKPGETFTRPGMCLPNSFAELYGINLEADQIICEAVQYRHVDDSPKEEATPKTLNEILGL